MNELQRSTRSLGLAAATALALALVGAAPAGAARHTATASVADGVLSIVGSNTADAVAVDFTNPDSVAVDLDGVRQSFGRRTFGSVSVALGSGDDRFQAISGGSAATDLPLTFSGGSGNDSVVGGAGDDTIAGNLGDDHLLGGSGTDLLLGGRGVDFADGGVGTDTELLGSGDDVASWVPGEGSDTVLGGSGRDTLAFAGSNGDEVMALAANGGQAVFFRSPGGVRMDLDDVERLVLATLGGVDSVTLGDLGGTDLDEAAVDLSVNGAGDAKDDLVTVKGTDEADDIAVTAVGGAVDVSGLHLQTHLTGSEPSDRLEIDALGGSDQVDVADAAKALIGILVDFGQ